MAIFDVTTSFDASWEADFEQLAFTAEALFAHPEPDDQELGRLAQRLASVLGDWEEIDFDGRHVRRAAIHAAASVGAADAALDHAIGVFAKDLLAHVGGDHDHALYKRFFPEPHEDITELGLDAELPAAMLLVLALDRDEELPAELREHLEPLRAGVQLGNGALAGRAEALAEVGRHRARALAWKESARAMHANLYRTLGKIAERRKLPPRWARHFFMTVPLE